MHLLHNVHVYTMDNQSGQAEAMVFDKENIVAVGDGRNLENQYPQALRIDGRGMTVLPGFIDPHIHFLLGAFSKGTVDCSPLKAPDVSSLKRRLKEQASITDTQQWIVGQGYDPIVFPGNKTPTRHDLDEVCPEHPAMIIHYSCHEVVLNTIALQQLGIDRHTPQPRGGKIVKDKQGEPTGRLIETPSGKAFAFVVANAMKHNRQTIYENVLEIERLLFGFGVTRIGDPAVSAPEQAFYREMYREGILRLPVIVYPACEGNMYDLPLAEAGLKRDIGGDDRPAKGHLKIFLDGADRAAISMTPRQMTYSLSKTIVNIIRQRSLNPLRIMLRSPGEFGRDLKLHLGVMMADGGELKACVKAAVENGHAIAFHAIGNDAIDQALDTIEASGVACGGGIPHRLEHAVFITEAHIQSIKKTGMAIATQPAFLSHMGSDNLPPINGFRLLPLRTFIDAGIHVAGSSDWPVVTCNPLEGIERAVTRRTIHQEILQREEAVTVEEAIGMYTREGAYLLGQSDRVGSLEPGKRADFIVLSENPFNTAPDRLGQLQVEETYLGGVRVHSKKEKRANDIR